MPITVNHSTPADGSFSASGATAWNANHSLVGVGTMAEQDANNVAITGGSISGVSGIGTVTSVAQTVPSFLSVTGSPITSSGTLAIGYSGTALPIANGGTGATVANGAMANLMGFTSTATAAGTTTLTNTSTYLQVFTGTLGQTIVLPVTSTLQTGWAFKIVNNSTTFIAVQSSGLNNVFAFVPAGTTVTCTCVGTTLTTAADWEAGLSEFSTSSGTGNVLLSNGPTVNGAMLLVGSAAANSSLGTSITSGTLTIGGTSGTGTLTVGQSTVSQTTNIQAGATASGSTKTINFGTGGLTGSTTTMAIGSTFGTTATCNGKWIFSAGLGGGAF